MGVKMDGVYSDFKCLVVRGIQHADGVYELYFAIQEKLDDKTGAVKASKVLRSPPEARVAQPINAVAAAAATTSSAIANKSFFADEGAGSGTGGPAGGV